MSPAMDQGERRPQDAAGVELAGVELVAGANASEPAEPSAVLELVVTANWVAPSSSRAKIREWLDGHEWPSAERDDLILAVSEAVSNSVEHGYGISAEQTDSSHAGTVAVHAEVQEEPDGSRRVVLTITDQGTWREPGQGPTNRRQGIRIMRACTEEMIIDHSPGGTVVVLRGRPVATPLPRF